MILINRTYEIITEESAADGDTAEVGFLVENAEYGFRELVELLKYGEASAWRETGCTSEWVSHDQGQDFRTGEYETHSTHYSRDNPPRNAKYWRWAMRAAGLTR